MTSQQGWTWQETPVPGQPERPGTPAGRAGPQSQGQAQPQPQAESEWVVLLDESGAQAGVEEKSAVHHLVGEGGTALHLAFSCHVYAPDGRFLLTRRALGKQAFPGVWTNGFCGHPAPGESPDQAVLRRAPQELGVPVREVVPLLPDFRYRAADSGGMEENEICPVFRAVMDTDPAPVAAEVDDWTWVDPAELAAAVRATPRVFSPWLVLQVEQGALG